MWLRPPTIPVSAPQDRTLISLAAARHAVIDAVRAARKLPGAGGGRRFAAWGHSQGGQAALFTGMIAARYAPELALTGVAAAAPATDLAALMDEDLDSPGGKNITAMTLWSWQRVFGAPMSRLVDRRAMPTIDRLAQECIEGPYDLIVRRITARPLEQHFLKVKNPAAVEPWRSLLAANTPDALPPAVPLFIAQGADDLIVHPQVTRAYTGLLCKAGNKVALLTLPKVGHGSAASASARQAVAWMSARFAGEAPPDDCVR
jgi:pimeloyl-ACP methyl ester carboxylesterase